MLFSGGVCKIAAVAVIWFFVSVGFIMPMYQNGDNWYLQFLPDTTSSTPHTVPLIEKLGSLTENLFSLKHLIFLLQLFIPLGMFTAMAPAEMLIGVPTLFELMLYTGPPFGLVGTLKTWHVMAVVPAFFVGAIYGIDRLARSRLFQKIPGNRNPRALCICFLTLSTIGSSLSYGAYSFSSRFRTDDFQVTAHDRIGHEILGKIPDGTSVSTTSHLSAHLAHRKELYHLPIPFQQGDWKGDETLRPQAVDYVVVDTLRAVLDEMANGQAESLLDLVNKIGRNPNYVTEITRDGYVVFKFTGASAE